MLSMTAPRQISAAECTISWLVMGLERCVLAEIVARMIHHLNSEVLDDVTHRV